MKERLLQFVEYKGLSKAQFYKKAGLSNGFLDNKAEPNIKTLVKILNAFPELNLNWVILFTGDMINGKLGEEIEGRINDSESPYVRNSLLKENYLEQIAFLKNELSEKNTQINKLITLLSKLKEE